MFIEQVLENIVPNAEIIQAADNRVAHTIGIVFVQQVGGTQFKQHFLCRKFTANLCIKCVYSIDLPIGKIAFVKESILPAVSNIKAHALFVSKTSIAKAKVSPVFWCAEISFKTSRHIFQFIR